MLLIHFANRPLAVFKTTDQPAVVAGNWTAAGFCFLLAITAVALAYLQHSRAKGQSSLVYEDGELESASERPGSEDSVPLPTVEATKTSGTHITTAARA